MSGTRRGEQWARAVARDADRRRERLRRERRRAARTVAFVAGLLCLMLWWGWLR